MTFLTPLLAGIAAAIAIPSLVILYFLKLRRRDLEVSTTLLWKKAIQDLQANAPFQKLRRNILLLLQLLALAAGLFALAQPMIKGQILSGQKHVILIDRSGSMAATDAGTEREPRTRLEEAKKQAIALVESMKEGDAFFGSGQGDSAMVVAFDNQGEPLQPFTSDKRVLREAIERITITDKTTAADEAVRVALAHLKRRNVEGQEVEGLYADDPVTIHLFSDGKITDIARVKPGAENTVVFHQLGAKDAPNVGITGLKAERGYERPQDVTIFASLLNTQGQDRQVDVELTIDGSVAGIQSATIPAASTGNELSSVARARAEAAEAEAVSAAGADAPAAAQTLKRPGTTGVVFRLERSDAMLAQVRLRAPGTSEPPVDNVLPTDDRAWLSIPPAKRMSVAIVGRRNLFLRSALEGLPLARLDVFSTPEFERLWTEGKAGVYDVVVLDGEIPNVGQQVVTATTAAPPTPGAAAPAGGTANAAGLGRALPTGNYVLLGAVPAGVGLVDKGTVAGASMIDWNRDHPVTRYLVLDPLRVATFRNVFVEPGNPVETLASAEKGPAILEISKGDTHAIVVPFDYMESNWPLDVSFVVFMASSVSYLGHEVAGRLDARALTPGGELRDRIPADATDARLRSPGGETMAVAVEQDGSVIHRLGPTTGVYELTWNGSAAPGDVRDPETGRSLRVYASNMLDLQESDVGASETLETGQVSVRASAEKSSKADRRLWPYILLAALAVVMLEWFVYNRKVQI